MTDGEARRRTFGMCVSYVCLTLALIVCLLVNPTRSRSSEWTYIDLVRWIVAVAFSIQTALLTFSFHLKEEAEARARRFPSRKAQQELSPK